MNNTLQLMESLPMLAYAMTALIGLLLGSFLNVIIYRLPRMVWQETSQASESSASFNLAWPNSHCPLCQAPVKAWQNIPLVSYLLLKGRCDSCNERISLQYPMVEMLAALLGVFALYRFGLTQWAISFYLISLVLLALTVIDLQTFLLPDRLTLPLLWSGLLYYAIWQPSFLVQAVWGAALGYLLLWSIYQLFRLITGKEGMGYGDFKLLAALGAWTGALQLPALLLLSALTGLLIGIVYKICHPGHRGGVPFGPALALSGWLCLAFPDTVRAIMTRLFV